MLPFSGQNGIKNPLPNNGESNLRAGSLMLPLENGSFQQIKKSPSIETVSKTGVTNNGKFYNPNETVSWILNLCFWPKVQSTFQQMVVAHAWTIYKSVSKLSRMKNTIECLTVSWRATL